MSFALWWKKFTNKFYNRTRITNFPQDSHVEVETDMGIQVFSLYDISIGGIAFLCLDTDKLSLFEMNKPFKCMLKIIDQRIELEVEIIHQMKSIVGCRIVRGNIKLHKKVFNYLAMQKLSTKL